MDVVAYLRVSTGVQVEEGLGLEVQQAAIAGWCKARGHRIVAWTRDAGVSGTKAIEEREGLAEALNMLRDGIAQGLVVAKLDRLARSLTVQEGALAHAWDAGASVFAVDQGEIVRDDPDDPMRTAMRQMVGVFSQLERAMIAKRLRDGIRHKAAKGGYAGGAPRLGRRAEARELVADEDELAVVWRIVELRDGGASLREIAAVLTAEGLRTKRGGRWHPYTIALVLGRERGKQVA